MQKFFNHILVPVVFNKDTAMLMSKAIAMANYFNCDIHLLHVQTPLTIPFIHDDYAQDKQLAGTADASAKMNQLVVEYRSSLKSGLLLDYTIGVGNWHAQTKNMIIAKRIDLVILPRYKAKFLGALLYKIDVNQLSLETQCPVLTINRHFEIGKLQHIVIPVGKFLPLRKLTAATSLTQKFSGVIHLMGYEQKTPEEDKLNTDSLTRSYHLLRDYTRVKIYCSSVSGSALADDTLAYAQQIRADLIVVNSGKESRLKGWFSQWIGKYLYRESEIPVLTIAPKY